MKRSEWGDSESSLHFFACFWMGLFLYSMWEGKKPLDPSLVWQWDPGKPSQTGTWDPSLQSCKACTWTQLSSSYKHTKKLYGTKNNPMYAQLGQILDNPPLTLNTTKGWANHLSYPSRPTPRHHPTLTPGLTPTSGSHQGNLLFVIPLSYT